MTPATPAPTLAGRPPAPAPVPSEAELSTAELAECPCPEFCERDHDRD